MLDYLLDRRSDFFESPLVTTKLETKAFFAIHMCSCQKKVIFFLPNIQLYSHMFDILYHISGKFNFSLFSLCPSDAEQE